MQFIANGPDIPDALLQAHEDGRVVFFCGAGISYPAGLPSFKGLVDNIYELIGTGRTNIEQEAYDRNQFDATLDLLERRIPGRRIVVRETLEKVLKPKLRRKGATDTHIALLRLARSREGAIHLVTTNFDRVFEHVLKKDKNKSCNTFAAPMLPIPKSSRWNGIVYLHGLLSAKPDESDLHRLVLTSGDFGLAYLTERWAARFVSELFRNYVVCFVGYSINDPVLRYMMDAMAADRMLGEVTPQAYALADCESGQEQSKTIEWEAKGVMPILYKVPSGNPGDHSALHQTLNVWAEAYRDGGKERIVVEYALAKPSVSTQQDDFVGRMLWALSHDSGLPAKRFSELNPVPSLDWLDAFSDKRFQHGDLSRFGITPQIPIDPNLQFSLVSRPTPYTHSPWMSLFANGKNGTWDDVMPHLARWLIRHLNDPKLIYLLSKHAGQLHWKLRQLIENELDRFDRLECDDQTSELDEIRVNSPNAIPSPMMRKLWHWLLAGRMKSSNDDPELDLNYWESRLKRDGPSTSLRLELRELLAPRIALRKQPYWSDESEARETQPIDWQLVLATDGELLELRHQPSKQWQEMLPALLEDFQQLLKDALDLLCEMGKADKHHDWSFRDLPSISPHWQNQGFHHWVMLIELLRDAWLAVRDVEPMRATQVAHAWFELSYPTFKRLAFFAASKDDCIAPEQWVEGLLADDAWWLWCVDTQREVLRLLVLQGSQLSSLSQDRLETAILIGPPREMYRDDIEPERWQNLVERSVWLRLVKLDKSGLCLGDAAQERLANLSAKYPLWEVAPNQKDEFPVWISGSGDPDHEDHRYIDSAPRKRGELVHWLNQSLIEHNSPFYEDNWPEICRTRFFHSLCALHDLAQEGEWLPRRWMKALQVWSEESILVRSWHYAAPLVRTMPDKVLQEIVQSVTSWLDVVSESKLITQHEDILLDLCHRILALPLEATSGMMRNGEPINQPVTEAINHPIGHITQAMLNLWFKQKLNDNDQLPAKIEPFFSQLCDIRVDRFRHGRVVLSSQLIALFRVDCLWTEQHLLPLFDWTANPAEAKAVWEGFLWSPRLYRPLLIAFKPQFLESARHYYDLGTHAEQFAAFLTYAALEQIDGYTTEEFRSAFKELPLEGLQKSAQVLVQALEGAADQREEYWRNRVEKFWKKVWPKSRDLVTKSIAESLARLCVAAGSEFPSALKAVKHWLKPIEYPHYVVKRLSESGFSTRFPADVLQLLGAVIDDQKIVPQKLGECLSDIVQSAPKLAQDTCYKRLLEYSKIIS